MEIEESIEEPQEIVTKKPLPAKRVRKASRHFRDYLPSNAIPAIAVAGFETADKIAAKEAMEKEANRLPQMSTRQRTPYTTEFSSMGLSRQYPDQPTSDPDGRLELEDLYDDQQKTPLTKERSTSLISDSFAPFENLSTYLLVKWANSGETQKTITEVTRLVKEVILAPGFQPEELNGFSLQRENKLLDKSNSIVQDGWKKESVKIRALIEGAQLTNEKKHPEIEIKGLHHRRLVDIIAESLSQSDAWLMHYTPYKEYWKPTGSSQPQRIYGELYSSDAWLEAHEELQTSPSVPNDDIENVVLPLMLWSDSTHLTNFGSASLWPLYMYFGGYSKYIRDKPSAGTGHHVAYIPSVSYGGLTSIKKTNSALASGQYTRFV